MSLKKKTCDQGGGFVLARDLMTKEIRERGRVAHGGGEASAERCVLRRVGPGIWREIRK